MKMLLSNNGGYKMYVETRQFLNSKDSVQLRFLSTFDGSKNPEEEQVKFEIILTEEQRKQLKELL